LQRPVTSELLEQKKGLDTLVKFLDKTDEEINQDHVFNNNRYIRVGDDYYERIEAVTMHGNLMPVIEKRSRQTLMDDFGKGFLKEIPKFKTFCNVPNYLNYEPVVNDSVNLFYPFTHQEKEGQNFDTIIKMLFHIFRRANGDGIGLLTDSLSETNSNSSGSMFGFKGKRNRENFFS
jgi:hypothetical protein